MNNVYQKIGTHVKGILGGNGSHGMDHVLRVTRLCELIGMQEGADMAVLVPAALLHDSARPLEKSRGIPHEIEGSRMAEEYLKTIHYDVTRIPGIVHAIRTHRFSSADLPVTLEARILSDADKLDAMGAVGIARTFIRAGEHGGGISDARDHFHDKLLNLKENMYTASAREIAKKRHAILVRFLARLEDELDLRHR